MADCASETGERFLIIMQKVVLWVQVQMESIVSVWGANGGVGSCCIYFLEVSGGGNCWKWDTDPVGCFCFLKRGLWGVAHRAGHTSPSPLFPWQIREYSSEAYPTCVGAAGTATPSSSEQGHGDLSRDLPYCCGPGGESFPVRSLVVLAGWWHLLLMTLCWS